MSRVVLRCGQRVKMILLLRLALAAWALGLAGAAAASALPEYRLKAAFVYNFVLFTEWPAATPATLTLCIVGEDPFGAEIDGLQGKPVAARKLALRRLAASDTVRDCQVVYIAPSAMRGLPALLKSIEGQPVLTLADSPDAMQRGVILNMGVAQDRISFEANLQAARSAGLNLSSRLLRLATEVRQ